MTIDQRKCIGCGSCMIACKVENLLPAGLVWNRIKDYETGTYPDVKRNLVLVQCAQCKNPACQEVCPTGATTQRDDGIVVVDYDKCMGCGSCEVACPYGTRQLYRDERFYFGDQSIPPETLPHELRYEHQKFRPGAATKCVFCCHRIDEGLKKGLRPGVDVEATPACVVSCPVAARCFGDLEDPDSEISQLLRSRDGFPLLKDMGTDPSVYYLPK